jgi:hypothetical protein
MPSEADNMMLTVTITASLLSAFAAVFLSPQNFLVVLVLIPFFVGAYWAYIIRHSLAVGIYRNQALGITVLGILLGIGILASSTIRGSDPTSLFLGDLFAALPYGFTFYWVDASMLAVRRADPLLRDTFKWTRTRFIFWPLLLTGLFLLLLSPFIPASLLTPLEIDVALALIYFSVGAPFVFGVVLLPVLARRSGDASLPRHLRWFAFFALMLVLFRVGLVAQLLVYGSNASNSVYLTLGNILLLSVAEFCLYRSARALAPLNPVSVLDFDAIGSV